MARVLSAIQPSGELHLGNYLGALRQWVTAQTNDDALYAIVDLHALTLDIDPAELRRRTLETAAGLLAVGLDPQLCTIFVQGQVPEHTELTWLLECTASYGELRRMTQFKDKGQGQESVRASLLTYPVLMAADILLYQTERVPVGDDQRQHLELARNLAERFNARYGPTFVVPEAVVSDIGARVMDLQNPDKKMSKSTGTPLGTIGLFDSSDEIAKKIRRAVTDAEHGVVFDRAARPGAANLLEILSAITLTAPEVLAEGLSNYGELKASVTDALIDHLGPIQTLYKALQADHTPVIEALTNGREKARSIASPTLCRARLAIGLYDLDT